MFVCDTMGSGGAERVISTLSNEFVKNDNDVSIVMLSKNSQEPFYSLDEHIDLCFLTKNISRNLGFLRKAKLLKQHILSNKPDIVISFLSYVCIYTWWALKNTKIPYIVSERNDPNQRGKLKQFLLNKSFKRACGCVFQTEDALNWYGKKIIGKSEVIYNPVCLNINPNGTLPKSKQILYVGRLTEQKNCAMLIEAFSIFSNRHPDYFLKIIGSGPLKETLLERISKSFLKEKVSVCVNSKTWQQDEINSSLFVLPSKYEGMPNVLLEALCLGMPSVSTNCPIGGPKELKKIFPHRLILSLDDAQSFASAMEEGIKIKKQNPFVPNQLSVSTIVSKWLAFINRIIERRK